MKREFLLNVLFLVLVNLIVKPFYVFGIERTIQERVGTESYGLYATLFSFSFLLFMVNDFGIHYFNNTTLARHPHLLEKYFPNILILKGLLAMLYLALVMVAAALWGFEPEIFPLLFFVALNHVFVSMVAYLRSNVSGVGMYRSDSALSTLDKLLLIVICALLLWGNTKGGDFQIEWFVHALNLSWFLTAAAAFFLVKKAIKKPLRFRWNAAFMAVVLKKSAPYALAVFLMTAYTRLDIVLLEWLLPDGRHEAGVYAAAYRLLDAFNMAGYLFAGLLLPMFSNLLKPSGTPTFRSEVLASSDLKVGVPEISSLLRTSLQLIWAGTATFAAACFLFKTELMFLIYPKNATHQYGEVMGWLILTLVPFSGVFIYSCLLTANQSLLKMNRLFALGIVLNLALNLLLIPGMKAEGAAISALATQTFVLAGLMFFAKRELGLPLVWRQVLKMLAFGGLLVAVQWGIAGLPGVGWAGKFCGCIGAGLGLAFLLRLIQWKALLAVAKPKTGVTGQIPAE